MTDQPTALVCLSGGIDSASCLYQHLRTSPERVLVMHIKRTNLVRTRGGRGPYERRAVVEILEWLRAQGLGHFEYMEAGFEQDLPFVDTIVVALWIAVALKRRPGVHTVIWTASRSDSERLPNWHRNEERRRQLIALLAGREVRWVDLNAARTKAEVIAALPPDLLALTWSCRQPGPDGTACGACHACLKIAAERGASLP